jgi:hypothetical protein
MRQIGTLMAAVKTVLEADTGLADVPVIVYDDKDGAAKLSRETERQRVVLLIMPMGGKRNPRGGPGDPFDFTFHIEAHAKPVQQAVAASGTMSSDEAAERAMLALDGWKPTGQTCNYEINCTDITFVPDPDYLIWRVICTVPEWINATENEPPP